MNRIVSQDELDVLLTPDEARAGVATSYDFRRRDRVSKEHLRSIHLLHERFAHNAALSLSAFLRTTTELTIVSVDQLAYSEFLSSLPDATAFYALAMPPLENLAALEISPAVAFPMVDRMLGGTGQEESPDRPLTEIEQNVVDSVVKVLLDHLTETWRGVVAQAQFKIHGRDTRPQMLQVTGPNEIVILIAFALRIGEALGTLRVCLPASAIEAAGDTFAQAWHRTRRPATAEESAHLAANLGRMPLAVSAQLSTMISARELIALRAGDVLSLGHQARQPVTVSVGDVAVFVGQLLVINNSVTIRVQDGASDPVEGPLG